LADEREKAREKSVRAMRAIEKRVRQALQGDRLRGIPNIGTRALPMYAHRVTSARNNAGKMPIGGREVLVVAADGSLNAGSLTPRGPVMRPVDDDELVFEDLEAYARVITDLLERHAALTAERADIASGTKTLAETILLTLDCA